MLRIEEEKKKELFIYSLLHTLVFDAQFLHYGRQDIQSQHDFLLSLSTLLRFHVFFYRDM